MKFTKPKRLSKGDKVAVIAPSSGLAHLFPHIYQRGIDNLKNMFGLEVKEYSTTRADNQYLYQNPKKRAEDINLAFQDPEVKAIFTTIGGDDSIRILPFLDKQTILQNPKLFMGSSDQTAIHLYLNQLGIASFYGPTVMAGFAQLQSLEPSYKLHIESLLFNRNDSYNYQAFSRYSEGYPDWSVPENTGKINKPKENDNKWILLQGNQKVQGQLIGGCVEVLEMMKGTTYYPNQSFFKDKILFLETALGSTSPEQVKRIMRNYSVQGVLQNIGGLLIGRPRDYTDEMKTQLYQNVTDILKQECDQPNLPVLANIDFGHTDPQSILPYGIRLEIDCSNKKLKLIESCFN